MSRAFVKEPDGDETADEQPEIPVSPHPNYVTPQGLAALRAEHAHLMAEKTRLGEAPKELEDKLTLRQAERRLRYVTQRIEHAILVDPAKQPLGEVAFGAAVTVRDADGKKRTYTITGEDEADAAAGKVSYVSPLARALKGAAVGDFVTWKRPAGDTELEILKIAYEKT